MLPSITPAIFPYLYTSEHSARRSRAILGTGESLLFGMGLALGLTRRLTRSCGRAIGPAWRRAVQPFIRR